MRPTSIIPLPVLLGFALSLAIVVLAHADTVPAAEAPAAAVEQKTTSKYNAEDEGSGGWWSGFKSLFSWRVGGILEDIDIEVEQADAEAEERRDR